MEWSDDAVVLSARPHGESSALAMLLTRDHGRHAGLLPGARAGRRRALLEPGTQVRARWRARLSEHLGTLTVEPVRGYAAGLLDDAARLAALAAACAVVEAAVPEREPHPALYDGLLALLGALDGPVWDAAYVQWELGLLSEVGFGLDLERCAATGASEGLAYVSPRTGRAVAAAAGDPYADRLLRLPGFLTGGGGAVPAEVRDGLALTGHFLERHVLALGGRGMPSARRRLAERYGNGADRSGNLRAP